MNLTRRDVLKLGAMAVAWPAPAAEGDYAKLTAVEMAALIRRGEITAESCVSTALARADRLKELNVFISINRQGALTAARAVDARRKSRTKLGPLAGVPLIIKDNIDSLALPTTAGCRGLAANRPLKDAPVLAQLLSAGGILLGKANMHELADGITSNNAGYGAVHNPYNPDLIPGGSSGGTAAGVAARIAPSGLGTDTAGSVRIPSSLCGVAGLRPTAKRYPLAGIVPLSHTRDTAGPIARTVADAALLDSVVMNIESEPIRWKPEGTRLGLPRRYFWGDLDGETEAVMNEAVRKLKDLGVVFVEADPPNLAELTRQAGGTIQYEMLRDIQQYLEAGRSAVTLEEMIKGIRSPDVARAVERLRTNPPSEAAYDETINKYRPELQDVYADYFLKNGFEAMLFPATALPARPIGAEQVELGGKQVAVSAAYIRNAAPGSVAGIPGLTLPAGMTKSGLPVGMELDGPMNSDRRLLAIGIAMEAHFGPVDAPRL